MTRRLLVSMVVMLAALFFVAGCERADSSPFTAEVDEPGYRRGKELLRQGRNQEALAEFQKVVERRGLNNAPESHLELGLLYHQHIKDPIAAIYHYRRYRELKPNSPQADLVRQNIDAATKDFARTLPGQPLENQANRMDLSDVVQRLQAENEKLKAELSRLRSANLANLKATSDAVPVEASPAPAEDTASNPVRPVYPPPGDTTTGPAAPIEAEPRPARAATALAPTPRPANSASATKPTTAGSRRHVVSKGDTLSSLAQRYYGNRARWRDIYSANRDVMKSEGDLRIGMEIKIPQ